MPGKQEGVDKEALVVGLALAAAAVVLYLVSLAKATPTGEGTISVETVPTGADVIFDGSNVGVTPLSFTVSAGVLHTIRLELDGYHPVEITDIILANGATLPLSQTLVPISGTPPATSW